MVAVRMVSEGVDVPRLAVGVYATTTSTPLFFAQAVGRFVRARRRGETASIFVPSVPLLLSTPPQLELERDHVLGRAVTDEADIFAAEDDAAAPGQAGRERLGRAGARPLRGAGLAGHLRPGALRRRASSATRARCTSARRRRWTSSASRGCWSPTRCATCCGTGRASAPAGVRRARRRRPSLRARSPPTSSWPACAASSTDWWRRWYHRTGQPHGVTHTALRQECGGPAAAAATSTELARRIALLREWATRSA